MNILFLGDVVGSNACRFIQSQIYKIRKDENIDIVIVNGENSADGNGITPKSYEMLSFADVVTTGNHCFRRKEIFPVFESNRNLIRPANFPDGAYGNGVYIIDKGRYRLAVINLMGVLYLEALDNPFNTIDKLLEEIDTPNIFVDFHAEATAEKKALGQYLMGRVTAFCGTHTHVQTADETILPGGTAYITDVGMCGAELSVLGVKTEISIRKQKTHIQERFVESDNPQFINGVVIGFNEKTGKADSIKRIVVRQGGH